jgi:hypothetical protein
LEKDLIDYTFSMARLQLWKSAFSGYHSNEMSSVNMLHKRKVHVVGHERDSSLLFLTRNSFLCDQMAWNKYYSFINIFSLPLILTGHSLLIT